MATNAAEYMKKLWKLDLTATMPKDDRIRHVAAIIHFIKLRCALLTEFDL